MTLLAWLHERLGYADTRELLADLAQIDEGFDADGRSYALARLSSRRSQLNGITISDLARYDANIRNALASANAGRNAPITLRYFQYSAALYTEVFLDHWRSRTALLKSLNDFVRELNTRKRPSEPAYDAFAEADLDKLAFWMATGSGKTLMLHLNYRQFLHYCREPLDNIVLITPNEGLSEQHLAEMADANIPCQRLDLGGRQLNGPTVQVTEITKLVLEKRGEGQSVPVEAFEGNNLIFVDEGHKGSGGDAWRQVRDAIGATGFTFEYSATFGQALSAARNDALTAEYGKAIAFDYSYRHFYNDGHGKDFSIVNLLKDPDDELRDVLLFANLLSLHEQHTAFRANPENMRRYKLEQPLWALVGASVNAVYTQDKRKRSDVLTAVRFLHRVLTDASWSMTVIERLLDGRSGLDGSQGDLFRSRFGSMKGRDPHAIHADLLRHTLHARSGGGLHLCDIVGAEGELGLKVAGSEDYFGLIYIGDTTAFKRLVQADDAGITIERDAISGSLFDGINRPGTTIEILIGARKFLEGWNSWRVSSMGLLNIGRSEGAQIIQMFGRGVRLKGAGMSLKRSAALPGSHPTSLKLLETLNIFALRASYMARFREYLEREGVAAENRFEVHLPIRTNPQWLRKGLVLPRLDKERNFKREAKYLLVRSTGKVALDWRGSAQAMTSGSVFETEEASFGGATDLTDALDLVDWSAAFIAVAGYATERGYHNLAVSSGGLKKIMEDPDAYELAAPEHVSNPTTLLGMERLQRVVVAILCKWVDRQHRTRQARWESRNTSYQLLDDDDPNLRLNFEVGEERAKYIVNVPESQTAFLEEVQALASSDELFESDGHLPPRIHFDRHLYQPLLIEDSVRLPAGIRVSPPSLNRSERTFVEDLKRYWTNRQASTTDKTEIFLLRNLSRGRGVGFFEESGFYPDFILWIKSGDAQRIVFIEPHGMMNAKPYARDEKAQLHERLPDLARSLTLPQHVSSVTLDSFIVSATPFRELQPQYQDGQWTRGQFAEKHILFQEDRGTSELDYIAVMLQA